MRTLSLIALTVIFAGGAIAQAPAPLTQPATIDKYSWSKIRIDWDTDPFAGAVENFEDVRRRSVDMRRLERARGTGNAIEAARVEREMRAEQVIKARPPKAPRYQFVYKVVITNNSDKAIKEFDWDYVFFDAATGAEVGRRQFTGVEKISPGKSKELMFQVSSPPAQIISVYSLDKKERAGLNESVVILRIAYADGTVWQAP